MSKPQVLDIPFMELQPHHCREVTGSGGDRLALYCGQPKSGRTSYCAEHRRINLTMVAEVSRPNEHGGKRFRIVAEPRMPAALTSFTK